VHIQTPYSSTIFFFNFILPDMGGEISPSAHAIWPKRKRPEYMNKGTGLLQAEMKLVYYATPFEISVEGSGRAKHWRFYLFWFLLSLPFVVWGSCYWKYCDLQVLSTSTVRLWSLCFNKLYKKKSHSTMLHIISFICVTFKLSIGNENWESIISSNWAYGTAADITLSFD